MLDKAASGLPDSFFTAATKTPCDFEASEISENAVNDRDAIILYRKIETTD
jgi:hypothetical protein